MRLLALLLLLPLPAWAQQTAFNSQSINGQVRFSYQWQDKQGSHQLAFALNQADVDQAEAEFKAFDNASAQEAAFKAVQTEAKKLSVTGHPVEVTRTPGGYDIRGKNLDDKTMDTIAADLKSTRDTALNTYVTNQFYSKVDDTHIMPDHKRIAQRYAPAMAPFADAVQAALGPAAAPGADPRLAVNFMLHFFQSIPYDELLSRYTSNGAGFETPYGLLAANKGDCDTKSVALAASLRALNPTLKLTMVYVPNHAFVGVGLPQGPHDYALRLGGDVFVLADPTGPRFMDLGEVAPQALADLNAGQFSYQEIPF